MHRFPLVLIHWHDAYSPSGWQTLDDIKKIKPELVITVGFIIEQSKDKLTIAASVSGNDFGEVITIPKKWIFKRKMLNGNTT